jgi:hypothetical protein
MLIGGNGRIHFAFTGDNADKDWVIAHAVLTSNGKWRIDEFKPKWPAVYVDLALADDVWLLYAAADDEVPHGNTNTLFVVRMRPDGWTTPLRVTTPRQSPAYEPRIVVGRDSVVHAVWFKARAAGDLSGMQLWHASTRDYGKTWIGTDTLSIAGIANGLRAAIDHCGSVRVVFTQVTDKANVATARFHNGRWELVTPLYSNGHPRSLEIDQAGSLHIFWDLDSGMQPDSSSRRKRLMQGTSAIRR